ncbi:OmpA family protein [Tenacibaculum crassostreae]|uniref:OmpA family protein n=1 Tax=Tenacibaculum crassostreae TaxID=502683 RepID=UPI003894C1C1
MNKIRTVLITLLLITFSQKGEAQFWKKIKQKVENKIEKKVNEVLTPKKDSIKKTPKDKKSPTEKKETKKQNTGKQLELWTNYDFVPSNNVVFFDTFKDDEYGAFPARWDINLGSAEIARLNNEKAFLLNDDTSVFPLISNLDFSKRTTIELDIYCGEKFWTRYVSNKYRIKLWDKADYFDAYKESFKASKLREIIIQKDGEVLEVKMGDFGRKINLKNFNNYIEWHHVAIVINGKGLFQLYFDELKMLNLPKLGVLPTGITIQEDDFGNQKSIAMAIKAIKIAQGGNSSYKQIITDGRFVTNGILFNTGKAKLKPASNGVLKRIKNMLIDNPDWKFEIVGHTDSDGEEKNNLILSQNRAKSVKNALVAMGIAPTRLTILGKGESEPLNTNSTPEEKANNRRVVFILKK